MFQHHGSGNGGRSDEPSARGAEEGTSIQGVYEALKDHKDQNINQPTDVKFLDIDLKLLMLCQGAGHRRAWRREDLPHQALRPPILLRALQAGYLVATSQYRVTISSD